MVFMLRLIFALVVLLSATKLSLAEDPAYFQVTGVGSADVLNIRSEPSAGSQQIGSFQPGAWPIEVLEVQEINGAKWGRVHARELDGWVSMRFLAPVKVEYIANTKLPLGLNCGGTEPFWNVDFAEKKVTFEPMGAESLDLPLEVSTTARGRNHRFAVIAVDRGKRLTAMISRGEQCSDGMSDRNFSWRADIIVEDPTNTEMPASYEGCCSLPLR